MYTLLDDEMDCLDGATGKAGNGKRERETETGICTKREETTAPRSLFTNSSRDDYVTVLTAILFTKEHNNGLRVSSFGSVVKTRGSVCGETGTHAHLDY